ncbi:MAG: D-2-hydroxyacid dehydrogenase [Clostridiales bacterium]|nr:D-2-hydroxyacid dehydrogenase [Clostridiales bacterium]
MKIVILDGYTENPGDLSWEEMRTLGQLTVYDRTPPEQILHRIGDAEAVFVNKTVLNKETIEVMKNVRFIGVLATGYNVVDVQAAHKKNIVVSNIPAYATDAVAQFTFALLLELCHHVGHHNQQVQEGRWERNPDFCFWDYPLIELTGKTIGIIGYGRIGKKVGEIAKAFGMKVLVYDSHVKAEESKSLDTLLAQSDVISLHCPLFDDTREIIRKETIAKMKDGVMLINTSRGPLINEAELRDALMQGKIAAAAVDVVSAEPIHEDNPFLGLPNCIITPHIAWAPKEARQRLMNTAVENLRSFIRGKPQNQV